MLFIEDEVESNSSCRCCNMEIWERKTERERFTYFTGFGDRKELGSSAVDFNLKFYSFAA